MLIALRWSFDQARRSPCFQQHSDAIQVILGQTTEAAVDCQIPAWQGLCVHKANHVLWLMS